VEQNLRSKGYETYVPYRHLSRPWADRIKVAEVPLFPNYVFCRFNPQNRLPIIITPQVYSIVGNGRIPMSIPDEEIEAVKRVVQHGDAIEATVQMIEPGERVQVVSGSLRGLEGTVVQVKGAWRLVVMVTLLQRGVAAEIDRESVRVIAPPVITVAGSPVSMGM
jgi:transcription antitermination factor NusG